MVVPPPDDVPPDEPLLPDEPDERDVEPFDVRARAAAARCLARNRARACAFLRLASAAALARAASSRCVDVVDASEWTLSLSLPSSGAAPPLMALDAIATLPTTSTTNPTQIQPTFGNDFMRDHLGHSERDGSLLISAILRSPLKPTGKVKA